MSAVVVSIAGGQASGKKTVLHALRNRLLELSNNRLSIATLHMSYFSKQPLPQQQQSRRQSALVDGSISLVGPPDTNIDDDANNNNDTPRDQDKEKDKEDAQGDDVDRETIDAFDLDGLADAVELVISGDLDPSDVGGSLTASSSSAEGRGRTGGKDTPRTTAPDVLLMEGHYMLCHKRLLDMAHIKVFVDLDADVRLGWRVLRDTEDHSIPLDTVFSRYVRFGKRAFEETILPTKTLADIILPRGPEAAAIDLIAMGVWDDIRARKDEQVRMIRAGIASLGSTGSGGGSGVGGGGVPGHFSPMRSYSPTRPYVSKSRITIGEADLENFYDSSI